MKQSLLDLREAARVEDSTREECVARLQNLIDDEARVREDDIIKAVEQVEADVGPIGSFMANAGR